MRRALCVLLTSISSKPKKIPWIGYLAGAGSGPAPAFIDGMRDLGYVEAKNIGIVFRTGESRSERYADIVAEVIRLKVDVIVADGSTLALTVKKATSNIPIVVSSSTDPVGTGSSTAWRDLAETLQACRPLPKAGGKQLELLKEVIPGLNRVAILRLTGPANVPL